MSIYHNGYGVWLHGGYSDIYKQKLLGLHKTIAENGYNTVEHALNKLQGRINSGKINNIDDVIKVLNKPFNYYDMQGNLTKFYDNISIHVDGKSRYIITIVGRKK